MKKDLTAALALGLAAFHAPSAVAATPPSVVDLTTWDRSNLADGWSANALLDQDVYGPTGDEIGEVEDILVGPDNVVKAIIVETEAFLDIGDVHARVDWSDVRSGPNGNGVSVPVTQETLEEYRINLDDMRASPRAWRVGEFIGDSVALEDRRDYGYVTDVVFDDRNEILAVMVNRDYGYGGGYGVGPYAYPYYGYPYGWDPGYGYYDLPYTESEPNEFQPNTTRVGGPFDAGA